MPTYKVYFADNGTPKTGLTPTWYGNGLVNDEGSALDPQPSFTELEAGWYKFVCEPTEALSGVVDGGATLTSDRDRYVPVDINFKDKVTSNFITFFANDGSDTSKIVDDISAIEGANTVTVTINDQDGDPVPDADVALLNDGQTVTLDKKVTDVNGQITFAQDDGDYKLLIRKAGYSATVPESLVVSGETTETFTITKVNNLLPIADLQNVLIDIGDPSLVGVSGATFEAYSTGKNKVVDSRILTMQRLSDTTVSGSASLSLAKGGSFLIVGTYDSTVFFRKTITVSSDDSKNLAEYV